MKVSAAIFSLNQFSTRSSSMASVEFCNIPPLPWHSMEAMVCHAMASMEMESEYSMEVAVESMECHGNLRDRLDCNQYMYVVLII